MFASKNLLADVKKSLDAMQQSNENEKRMIVSMEKRSASQSQISASSTLAPPGIGFTSNAVNSSSHSWDGSPRRFLEPEDMQAAPTTEGGHPVSTSPPPLANAHRQEAEESREQDRLSRAEAQLNKRRAALRQRQQRNREQQQVLTEVEASLVELRQEVEVTERSTVESLRAAEEKENDIDKADAELMARTLQLDDVARVHSDDVERQNEEVEETWRRIEDQKAQEDQINGQEQQRLRRQVQDLEGRDSGLRDKQRALAEREHTLNARKRQLEGRRRLLEDIDRNATERLRGELSEREALLQQALASAGYQAHQGATPSMAGGSSASRTPNSLALA